MNMNPNLRGTPKLGIPKAGLKMPPDPVRAINEKASRGAIAKSPPHLMKNGAALQNLARSRAAGDGARAGGQGYEGV